jgi:hypothetical protein
MLAEAPELAEEWRQGGRRTGQDDQQRVFAHRGNDRDGARELQHGGLQVTGTRGTAEGIGGGEDRRGVRGNLLAVEVRDRITIDKEAVASEDDRRLDAIAATNGIHQITDTCHGGGVVREENDPTIGATIA